MPTEVLDRYGIQSVVDRIDDLYEQILTRRPKRRIREVSAPPTASQETAACSRCEVPGRPEARLPSRMTHSPTLSARPGGLYMTPLTPFEVSATSFWQQQKSKRARLFSSSAL